MTTTNEQMREALTKLLTELREKCAEVAEDTIVASHEGVDEYGEKAAEHIRQIELDVAANNFIAALAASPAPTEHIAEQWEKLCEAAPGAIIEGRKGLFFNEALLFQVSRLLSFAAPQPEAAQPALQEEVKRETLKQINELEVIADWIVFHSNTQWAKECGYPRIMIQYAEELHEIGLTLLSRVDPDRASQLRAMQKGETYYQFPQLDKEAAQPAPVPVAWAVFAENGNCRIWWANAATAWKWAKENDCELTALYAAPAQQEQAPQPLTDEERAQLKDALEITDYRYFGDYPFCDRQRDAVNVLTAFAYRMLSRHPAQPVSAPVAWISVEDRLPEQHTKVLTAGLNFNRQGKGYWQEVGVYFGESRGWLYESLKDHYQPTDWMPLPPAPGVAAPVAIDDLKQQNADWIEEVIQAVAELPDRTSPDDWPEAMLVTAMELRSILEDQEDKQ